MLSTGDRHTNRRSDHTHQKVPDDILIPLSRLSQNSAQSFSSSFCIVSFWVTLVIRFPIHYNRCDKNRLRGTQLKWFPYLLFLVAIQHRRGMWLVDHRLKLTSHCLADPDLYLSSSGKKPNVKPPLLSVSSESAEQRKASSCLLCIRRPWL